MTDPADHTTHKAMARVEALAEDARLNADAREANAEEPIDHTTRLFAAQNMLDWTTFNENERAYQEMVRYLLDRVREQGERIEALEEALGNSWGGGLSGLYWCVVCETRYYEKPLEHDPLCIVLTLPAPETVETQG